MKPSKTFLLLLLALLLHTGLAAQCADYIAEKSATDGSLFVRTQPLTLISRESYQYTIEFVVDGPTMMAVFQSINGTELSQGDEVIFVDIANNRRYYPFISQGLTKTARGSVIQENRISLDRSELNWLANTNMAILFIKNNRRNEIRKFTIQPIQQTALYRTAWCLTDTLDTMGN